MKTKHNKHVMLPIVFALAVILMIAMSSCNDTVPTTTTSIATTATTSIATTATTTGSVPSVTMSTNEYTIIAGAIKNTPAGWKLMQDDLYTSIGITGVSEDDQKITIYYNNNSKVSALTVTVDQAMAALGYSVNASVSMNKAYIYIFVQNHYLIQPHDYDQTTGYIWISGIFQK